MIAILIHHLKIVNEESPCEENEAAIASLKDAMEQLEKRTKDKIERGKEERSVKMGLQSQIYQSEYGLTVLALEDNPGHRYDVYHRQDQNGGPDFDGFPDSTINFQNGPVRDHGVNGLTNEALFSVLIHRLKVLDANFPCEENKRTIDYLQKALEQQELRIRNRTARGVNDSHQV